MHLSPVPVVAMAIALGLIYPQTIYGRNYMCSFLMADKVIGPMDSSNMREVRLQDLLVIINHLCESMQLQYLWSGEETGRTCMP